MNFRRRRGQSKPISARIRASRRSLGGEKTINQMAIKWRRAAAGQPAASCQLPCSSQARPSKVKSTRVELGGRKSAASARCRCLARSLGRPLQVRRRRFVRPSVRLSACRTLSFLLLSRTLATTCESQMNYWPALVGASKQRVETGTRLLALTADSARLSLIASLSRLEADSAGGIQRRLVLRVT